MRSASRRSRVSSSWPRCCISSSRMWRTTPPWVRAKGRCASRAGPGRRGGASGARDSRSTASWRRAAAVRVTSSSTAPVALELGVAVAHDRAVRDHGAGPELHHAEAVRDDRERGVRARQARTPVRRLVAELAEDRDHLVEGMVGVPQHVLCSHLEHRVLRSRRSAAAAGRGSCPDAYAPTDVATPASIHSSTRSSHSFTSALNSAGCSPRSRCPARSRTAKVARG